MLEQSREKLARVLCVLLLSVSGCDVVQGLRDANDAIFPSEKTYLDAPGYRLAAGGYRSLDFASGSSLYLLARSPDANDKALYSLLYADPKPCPIPNVGAYQAARGPYSVTTVIAYTEEGTSQGTLRFADADCHVFDLRVPNTGLPVVETSLGFVGQQNNDIVLMNPVAGTNTTLAANASYLTRFDVFSVLYASGKIGLFGSDLREAGWFGDTVTRITSVGSAFFFEDKNGIHRLDSSGGATPSVSETVLAPSGCSLGVPRYLGATERWVTYYAPCADKKVVIYDTQTAHSSELPFLASPRTVSILPAWPTREGDPAVDPFIFLFLRDVDANTGLGTLVLRAPGNDEKELGHNAALDRTVVVSQEGDTHGFAVVDVANNVGRLIRWAPDGTTTELSAKVERAGNDVLVRGDANIDDFALLTDMGLTTIAHDVAPGSFRQRDPKDRWSALLDEYDGANARLSITDGRLDFVPAASSPQAAPTLETIAEGVHADWRVQFISSVPGLAYLTRYDASHDVGRLEYRNLELRFTAQVSDGVSDYMSTDDGLIYSVPFGDSAGIWFTRAR